MAASTSSASPTMSTEPAISARMPERMSSWSSTRKTRGFAESVIGTAA